MNESESSIEDDLLEEDDEDEANEDGSDSTWRLRCPHSARR